MDAKFEFGQDIAIVEFEGGKFEVRGAKAVAALRRSVARHMVMLMPDIHQMVEREEEELRLRARYQDDVAGATGIAIGRGTLGGDPYLNQALARRQAY